MSFREGANWQKDGKLQSLESKVDKHLASIGATSAAAARPLAYLQGHGYIKYEKELGWFLIEVTASGADIARELHTLWGRANILYKQHKDGVLWFLATVLVSLLTALGVRLSA